MTGKTYHFFLFYKNRIGLEVLNKGNQEGLQVRSQSSSKVGVHTSTQERTLWTLSGLSLTVSKEGYVERGASTRHLGSTKTDPWESTEELRCSYGLRRTQRIPSGSRSSKLTNELENRFCLVWLNMFMEIKTHFNKNIRNKFFYTTT